MTSASRPILVTGHRGYIGSVLAPHLAAQGYDVTGLDTGYFNDCTLVPDAIEIPEVRKDIRDLEPADLRSFYGVVHLAALSNDPIGNLDARWTTEINHDASVALAKLARDAGVRRFLFSSSCIMYGMSTSEVVDETSPLDPKTEYARSKVRSEDAIRGLATDHFSPVFLRNGTVYGVSPRMRFDTVFNDLLGMAFTTGRVVVHSDGKPWRPVVHVEDVARSFQAVLEAPKALVHNQAFNNGAAHLNVQVIDLARIAVETVAGAELHVESSPGADQRTYRADFSKFAQTFPQFRWLWDARLGAQQVVASFREIGVTNEIFTDARFTRLRWLNHLLAARDLDSSLRWAIPAEASR